MATLVHEILGSPVARHPDKLAIIQRERRVTYAEFDRAAARVARWLLERGLLPGQPVVVLGDNSPELVAALFGVLKAGGAIVPVHPQTPAAKLAYLLTDCAPGAIILDPALLEPHRAALDARGLAALCLPSADVSAEAGGSLAVAVDSAPLDRAPAVRPSDLAAIIYTSGSTKQPKGVMETHANILFATSAINAVVGNHESDVVLCGIPLSFDYGLYQLFLTFSVGATLVLERDFHFPLEIPRLLKTHCVTGFPGVPSIFAMLLRSRLLERSAFPDLRYLTSTGDVFPPAHIRRLRELLPGVTVRPMYGLTECKRVSIMPDGGLDAHPASVGLPLPGTTVAVVDEEGNEVPPGTVGQLIISGPHVMQGYLNDPEETARRFRRRPGSDAVWLYSGDLFWRDADGFLYYIGRDEQIIKSLGQRVGAAEVERFLCEIDGVAEAGVVGAPDPLAGEAVVAFVCLNPGAAVTEAEIGERCRAGLTPAEQPRRIVILSPALPRTGNGKTDRKQLRALAATLMGTQG